MKTLKPCPFCGAEPYVAKALSGQDVDRWFVEHKHMCPLEEVRPQRISAFAIDQWNTRAPDPAVDLPKDECQKAVSILRQSCLALDGLQLEKQSCPEDMALWADASIRQERARAERLANALRRASINAHCGGGAAHAKRTFAECDDPNCVECRAALKDYERGKG